MTRAKATEVDDALAELQDDLVGLKKSRLQERWVWSVAIGALVLIQAFEAAGVTCGLILAIIYIMFVIVFGRICEVEGVEEALAFAQKLLPSGGSDDKPAKGDEPK